MIQQRVAKNGLVTMASVNWFGLSEEDGGKWVLMCEVHKIFIQDTNKKRLWTNHNESELWCEDCAEEFVNAIVAEKLRA
jgi:hypothetical protein